MRIATWNINSVRLRLHNIKRLVEEENPDILCLQETKVRDEDFPLSAIREMGFSYAEICGEKSYNGVAVLSRVPLAECTRQKFYEPNHCRHISVCLPEGIELHNFYVPAGGDEPDPDINPKFKHKLGFMDEIAAWFAKERKRDDRIILVGDLNIAPHEHDVWSHKQLLKIVSHTPVEVEKMAGLQGSLDWVDVARHFVPHSEKLYSWWSYRNRDWRASDRGRRLDHIWVTPPLSGRLQASRTLKNARDWDVPSDHVPVIVDIAD